MSKPTTAYEAIKINTSSRPKSWDGWNTLANDLQNGYIVLWQYHGVFAGIISNGTITWCKQPETEDKHIERIRAFNESKEYHFWRSSSGLVGRLRTDSNATNGDTLCADTAMLLRSVIVRQLGNSKEEEKWFITTRNYIDYNEIGQAGYVDSRFLKIEKK
ncbi:MAG: hypothetical protein KIS94_05020 [Chitinophagales bacterium]|nr:hypothetical protein [Chitinophagales bacterium]